MVIDIKVPTVGESITEVTLSAWLVEEGDYVEMDQPICELESDKATMELPAEKSGTIQFVASEGDDLSIGAMICKIDTSATGGGASAKKEAPKEEAAKVETQPAVQKESAPPPPSTSYASGHPSPAAKKILDEKGIDPASVNGTGKDGRITKEDAQNATGKTAKPAAKKEVAPSNGTPAVVAGSRNIRREKMSRLRRTIAKHLVNAKNNTAMLTTFNEADMTEILALRAAYKESHKERYGVSLGFMGFFMKACSIALMEMPDVNGQIDGDHVVYHDFVDMSIAVSTPKGLVTPVLRNVETLDLFEIEKGVKSLALKGRENDLKLEDMEGGTFTVSNGGVFGSLNSTPIINAPQSAILGMHKIQERPMVINGEVVARPMMYLALSYDHRIIDGKGAVTFLVRVKDLLENPVRMMLKI